MTTTPAAEAVMGHNANAANIEAMVKEDPKIVFRDPGVFPLLVEAVRARISAHPYDLTSAKGRSLITKLKSSVTSIKTLLDDTGKGLNEDHRRAINEVDGVRREVRDKLDGLADLAREPLTEWETAEEKKDEEVRTGRSTFADAARVPATATLEQIARIRAMVEAVEITDEVYRELKGKAEEERAAALVALNAAAASVRQAEADKLELDRLRAEKAEREAREAEAERKRVAEENARLERERVAAEAVESERRRVEAERAEEQRKRDEVDAELRRKAQAEVDAANARAAEAERARQAQAQAAEDERLERERVAQEEADKVAALEAENEARRRDQAHREAVIERACADIMNVAGLSKAKAMVIVQAIAAGSVSAVGIEF